MAYIGSGDTNTVLRGNTGAAPTFSGNVALPDTDAGGSNGRILLNSVVYFHNYGTGGTSFFAGYAPGNFTNTGGGNNGVGANVMQFLTSGTVNCAFGHVTLQAVSSGSANSAFGEGALSNMSTGSNNTAVGAIAGQFVGTGSNNTALGYNAGNSWTGANSNNICISNAGANESATIRIGTNATHTNAYIAGIDGVNVGSVSKVLTMASDHIGTATITAGAGISITPTANTITIAAAGAGFTWNEITAASANLAVENGYIINRATAVTLTLPATASLGDAIVIIGKGAGFWTVAQNANQSIHMGTSTSTIGIGGSITSTQQYDAIELICTVAGASTEWTRLTVSGNITVV